LTVAPIWRKPEAMDDPPSPFELAAAELARLGITLTRQPGEFRVNYRNGADATAQIIETLDQALEIGRRMAADRPISKAIRRPYRPRTPKAYNRWLRKKHMRKLRARAARAIRQDDKKE
jgi:hypothetical protein